MSAATVRVPERPDYEAQRKLLWTLIRELIEKHQLEELKVVDGRHGPRLARVVEGGKTAKIA